MEIQKLQTYTSYKKIHKLQATRWKFTSYKPTQVARYKLQKISQAASYKIEIQKKLKKSRQANSQVE